MNSKLNINQVILISLSIFLLNSVGNLLFSQEEPSQDDPPAELEEAAPTEEAVEGAEFEDEFGESGEDSFSDFDSGTDDSSEDVLLEALEADSLWQEWMGLESDGRRTYYFRRSFTIEEPPSSGHVYMTADDNFSLYVNGTYVADDDQDTLDWMQVKEFDISDYLQMGDNIIAVEATDMDDTRYGLRVGVIYETIPDIDAQLDLMVQREVENQRRAREGITEEEEGPTELEIFYMRAFEKNKLR